MKPIIGFLSEIYICLIERTRNLFILYGKLTMLLHLFFILAKLSLLLYLYVNVYGKNLLEILAIFHILFNCNCIYCLNLLHFEDKFSSRNWVGMKKIQL